MKLILWLILIALGVAILRYRYQIYNFTWEWWWANQYLGSNGTIVAISLIGMILIWAWAAYPFGAFDGFMDPRWLTLPNK